MAVTAPHASATAITGQPRASWRVDAVTVLLGGWLLVGLVVDGWAHSNLEALETFFTPLACAVLLRVCRRRLGPGHRHPGPPTLSRSGLEAFPAGYGLAVVGVVVFAVAGAGDLTWHSVFGIEQDLEALFSPTHLLLLAGRWRLPFGTATTI